MKNNQLEPAYLRYIYDGLVKGSIHPENAAELPEGVAKPSDFFNVFYFSN
jgi:hypothetical protein